MILKFMNYHSIFLFRYSFGCVLYPVAYEYEERLMSFLKEYGFSIRIVEEFEEKKKKQIAIKRVR